MCNRLPRSHSHVQTIYVQRLPQTIRGQKPTFECVFMAAIFYHVLEIAQEEGILQFRLTYHWIVSE